MLTKFVQGVTRLDVLMLVPRINLFVTPVHLFTRTAWLFLPAHELKGVTDHGPSGYNGGKTMNLRK